MVWEKLGRILSPNPNIYWMETYAGPSFAIPSEKDGIFDILVTGRDNKNRSRIGLVKFDINSLAVINISEQPLLELGEKGTFDENGTAYPCVVKNLNTYYLYYTGWIPGVLVSFMNDPGLAKSNSLSENFKKHSRASILPKTNEEPFGIGSVCVIIENGIWKMWYTCFDRWGIDESDHKHYYNIKYAESINGIHWERQNIICIDIQNKKEFSIARPSVLKIEDTYHMWYSYRGEFYRIGYAYSKDGILWNRRDDLAGITVSESGWDSESVCYSHVFRFDNFLYMLYNGNNYGKEGLGIARLKIENNHGKLF